VTKPSPRDLRILVLGHGGIGGYFGGRLAESGAGVTFLVREGRRKSLIEDGLRIQSSFGNATLTVKAVMPAQVEPN
jgi:2-dehydropantoate 2-reductase